MRFSERFGYKPVKEIIQVESMDEPLRNGLWSLLKLHCWDYVKSSQSGYGGGYYLSDHGNNEIEALCHRLWFNYFKKPLDQLSNDWRKVLTQLRTYFFDCKWYEAYDFIEFVANNYKRYQFQERFILFCNNLI